MTLPGDAPPPTGFIIPRSRYGFKVDARKIAPESYLATSLLLQEIVKRRELARGRMLDIGCGTKPYSAVFAPFVTKHIGVDVPGSPHSRAAVDGFSSATDLPFANQAFDFVLCTEVLEHVADPQTAYQEISRVLKPGGRALITTPFMYRVHEAPFDFYRYTQFAHSHLASKANLTVESITTRGGFITVAADYFVKGLLLLFVGMSRVCYMVTGIGKNLGRSAISRALLYWLQLVLFILLRKESIKSDTYTLGYVVVLYKPLPSRRNW